MSNSQLSINNSQLILYKTEDGEIKIDVRFDEDNLWLTQKLMAELFECSTDNISLHLKNIFKEGELDKNSVVEDYSVTASDGKKYKTKHYSLEAIIAVGYRVNTSRGTQFRTWATDKLKNYIFKGFAIDKERFTKGSRFDTRFFDELLEEIREIRASERMVYQKITDIYATSVDYIGTDWESLSHHRTLRLSGYYVLPSNKYPLDIYSWAHKRWFSNSWEIRSVCN